MLEKDILIELREKLPKHHNKAIKAKYLELFEEEVSRQSIWRFFNGDGYTEKLHKAILTVLEIQQSLIHQTKEAINA